MQRLNGCILRNEKKKFHFIIAKYDMFFARAKHILVLRNKISNAYIYILFEIVRHSSSRISIKA